MGWGYFDLKEQNKNKGKGSQETNNKQQTTNN
jgi:hypothetical protein